MSDHTLSTWELVVDNTVGSEENLEEKSREVADIRMYHFSRNFLQLGCDMLWWLWSTRVFFTFSTSLTPIYFQQVWPHMKYIRVGVWRHRGQGGEPGGEGQGVCLYYDVSHQLTISSTRTWYGLFILVDMKLFYTFNKYKKPWCQPSSPQHITS